MKRPKRPKQNVRYWHEARGPDTASPPDEWVQFREWLSLEEARASVREARKRWPRNKQRIVCETTTREVVR